MTAALKTFLAMLLAVPAAIWVGMELGSEEFVLPIALCVVLIGLAFSRILMTGVYYEAFVLSVLIFGYLVGNRGFAQISPSPGFPLFVGELGMVACIGAFLARGVLQRLHFIPSNMMSWVTFTFLMFGAVRLALDFRVYGINAIRDSAMVYYALFFFIAYHAGQHDISRKFIERATFWGLVVMLPAYFLQWYAPELIERTAVRGVPIIHQKGDLAGMFMGMGAIYFYLVKQQARRWRWILTALSLLCSAVMLINGQRAGYVATTAGLAVLWVARLRSLVVQQLAALAIALLIGAFTLSVSNQSFAESPAYGIYEKVISIFDPSGTGEYVSEGQVKVGNNAFRMVWWQSVISETNEMAPVAGLGFGYDLTTRFLQTYYGQFSTDDSFTARSPHSYAITVYGRLGLIGVAFLLVFTWLLVRGSVRHALAVARGAEEASVLIPWACAVVIYVGAQVGVVLEGPMGAVLFWSMLGLASSREDLARENAALEEAESAGRIALTQAAREPVAA